MMQYGEGKSPEETCVSEKMDRNNIYPSFMSSQITHVVYSTGLLNAARIPRGIKLPVKS